MTRTLLRALIVAAGRGGASLPVAGGRGAEPLARAEGDQHRPPGRRGRVSLQHDVRLPRGRGGRGRHARARHRRDEGQQGHRHARHHGRRQDERPRERLLADPAPDQAARRGLLVRASGRASTTATTCRAGPTASAASRPASASRPRATAQPTSGCRRWPRSCARSRARPINVEIKGRTPDEETPSTSRTPRCWPALLEEDEAQGPDRRLVPAGGRRPLPRARFRASTSRPASPAPPVWILGGASPGPGVVGLPGADHLRRRRSADRHHDEGERRARARQGYAWQNWFSGDDRDYAPSWRRLVDMCVDGIMTSQPRGARARAERKTQVPADCSCGLGAWSPTPSRSGCSAA